MELAQDCDQWLVWYQNAEHSGSVTVNKQTDIGEIGILFPIYISDIRDRGSTVVKVLCYNQKVDGSIPAGASGFFIDIKSF